MNAGADFKIFLAVLFVSITFWHSLICWQGVRIIKNRKTRKRQPYWRQGQRGRVSVGGDLGGIMTIADCQGTAWGIAP